MQTAIDVGSGSRAERSPGHPLYRAASATGGSTCWLDRIDQLVQLVGDKAISGNAGFSSAAASARAVHPARALRPLRNHTQHDAPFRKPILPGKFCFANAHK